MLAVKSTCKDRWRQVLAEADKIDDKHLLTLEPRISANQTSEMQAKRLQLVVPRPLHETYNADQQAWLFDIRAFTELALSRQPRKLRPLRYQKETSMADNKKEIRQEKRREGKEGVSKVETRGD